MTTKPKHKTKFPSLKATGSVGSPFATLSNGEELPVLIDKWWNVDN